MVSEGGGGGAGGFLGLLVIGGPGIPPILDRFEGKEAGGIGEGGAQTVILIADRVSNTADEFLEGGRVARRGYNRWSFGRGGFLLVVVFLDPWGYFAVGGGCFGPQVCGPAGDVSTEGAGLGGYDGDGLTGAVCGATEQAGGADHGIFVPLAELVGIIAAVWFVGAAVGHHYFPVFG